MLGWWHTPAVPGLGGQRQMALTKSGNSRLTHEAVTNKDKTAATDTSVNSGERYLRVTFGACTHVSVHMHTCAHMCVCEHKCINKF